MKYPAWTASLHHDTSELYVSNPLPQIGDTVTIRLRIAPDAPIKRIFIRAMIDGEFQMVAMKRQKRQPGRQFWSAKLAVHQSRIDYRFKIMADEGAYYYSAVGVSRADSPDFDSFVLLADYDAPLWVRDHVFYQIFPDRFYNGDPSNDVQDGEYTARGHTTIKREWGEKPYPWKQAGSMDFFGGDLAGITQKLNYLDDLGINALYLCPIFKAETNHRYDVLDFYSVDPHLGGNEGLAELRAATQQHGIKLMMDITPNHISYNHPWFTAAQADQQAVTAEYFYYNEDTGSYETWLGVPLLIKLNYGSQKLRETMYLGKDAVLRYWLKTPYCIDAWRLDVANMTGNRGHHQLDHTVWREMRQVLKQDKPDVYLLGEYFQDGTMHIQGDELDATMNYQGFNMSMRRWLGGEDLAGHDQQPYADANLLPSEAMAEQWIRFLGAIPYQVALQQFNQLDSHDTTRILHVCGGDTMLVQLGLVFLIAFPGTPCIYYGTEIGMDGFKDPDNRRTMIWEEENWDVELLTFTRQLIMIRKSFPALQVGSFQLLYAEGDLIAFLRESTKQRIIVIGYRGAEDLAIIEIDLSHTGLTDGCVLKDTLSPFTTTIEQQRIRIPELKHGQALLLIVS